MDVSKAIDYTEVRVDLKEKKWKKKILNQNNRTI